METKLDELKAYSAMIRERLERLGKPQSVVCIESGVSTKTLNLIIAEKWPTGRMSDQQKRGQAKAMKGLAPVLDFDPDEWMKKLELPNSGRIGPWIKGKTRIGKEELNFLLRVVDTTGPIHLDTALDLLRQRSSNS